MDIKVQYALCTKLDAYQTPRHYEASPNKFKQNIIDKKNIKKKLTFFDQLIKQNAIIPGPAKYLINPQNIQIKKLTQAQIEKIRKKQKDSYLDPVLKRSLSLPAVGKYSIDKYQKIGKQIKKQLKHKPEQIQPIRKGLFDSINRDVLNVCPGSYNIKSTLAQSPSHRILPQAKKKKSLSKLPSPHDYNPIPSSYSTFDKHSISSFEHPQKKSYFGQRPQIKLIQRSPGPIYSLISNWCPKDNSKCEFNVYSSTSLAPQKSIYQS